MRLILNGQFLEFIEMPLIHKQTGICDVFAKKNNKTVGETLVHGRYQHLSQSIRTNHPAALDRPLGEFLLELKRFSNPLYREFLNPDGDSTYCEFELQDSFTQTHKGIYSFSCGGEPKYIGRTTQSYQKRINNGCGLIFPKNCYLDGQRTNCRLNVLIAKDRSNVQFHAYPMDVDATIKETEASLLARYAPEWNKQLST